MKKIIAALIVCSIGFSAIAQTDHKDKDKDKVKKTTNIGDKIHNAFSSHKHYNGYKVKRKAEVNGHIVKEKKKMEYKHE